jgi:hypothetical protein
MCTVSPCAQDMFPCFPCAHGSSIGVVWSGSISWFLAALWFLCFCLPLPVSVLPASQAHPGFCFLLLSLLARFRFLLSFQVSASAKSAAQENWFPNLVRILVGGNRSCSWASDSKARVFSVLAVLPRCILWHAQVVFDKMCVRQKALWCGAVFWFFTLSAASLSSWLVGGFVGCKFVWTVLCIGSAIGFLIRFQGPIAFR